MKRTETAHTTEGFAMSATPEPFLSERHPVSRRWAIFEDDGRSAWLYLTEPDHTAPAGDCWLYNRIPAPDPSEIAAFRPGPPPAACGFAGPEALVHEPDVTRMHLQWAADGGAVALLADGVPLGFLVAGERRGTSRYLARTGPWGNTWDQARYEAVFSTDESSTACHG
jgi:hypothetical protein